MKPKNGKWGRRARYVMQKRLKWFQGCCSNMMHSNHSQRHWPINKCLEKWKLPILQKWCLFCLKDFIYRRKEHFIITFDLEPLLLDHWSIIKSWPWTDWLNDEFVTVKLILVLVLYSSILLFGLNDCECFNFRLLSLLSLCKTTKQRSISSRFKIRWNGTE